MCGSSFSRFLARTALQVWVHLFCISNTMPVTIETTFQISMDGSSPWKISGDRLKCIHGKHFVKLRAYDYSLISLVMHDSADFQKESSSVKRKFSLANVPGYKALLNLRNKCVEEQTAESSESDKAAALLFGAPDPKKKNKPRMNASQLKELRDAMQLFELEVPGIGERPALQITMLRPVHPCDELCVELDADVIEHLIHFIRSQGVTVDALADRREYRSTDCKGLWRNGSAGLVQRLKADSEDETNAPTKRFRSHNKPEDKSSVPGADGSAEP